MPARLDLGRRIPLRLSSLGPRAGGGRSLSRVVSDVTSLFDTMTEAEKSRVYISDLEVGARVDEVFLVEDKTLRTTRSGNPFLALELRDRTGTVQARVWERARKFADMVQAGGFVRVEGQVEDFNGRLQINVTALESVSEKSVRLEEFRPVSRRDPETMETELAGLLALIECPYLRTLTHHAVIGGLLEHTLSVAALCRVIADRYIALDAEPGGERFRVDRDLLLAGALLHDVGKTRELSWTKSFDYTDEGQLIGHIVLGAEMVTRRAQDIEGFPAEKLSLLRHMILSHHGQYEWGSPKRPKTMEAMILHYADDLDGKVNMISEFTGDEGGEPESRWTPYHRTLGRHLYRGVCEEDEAGE